MTKEFKIGDVVEIIEDGHCYSTYATFSLIQGVNSWIKHAEPEVGTFALVVNFGQHESNPRAGTVYVVEQENKTYIMSPKGLNRVGEMVVLRSAKTNTDSSRWNTKCKICGKDAYDSGFSRECSGGCY